MGWVRVDSLKAYMGTLTRAWRGEASGMTAGVYLDSEADAAMWLDVAAAHVAAEEVEQAMEELRQWVEVNCVEAVALPTVQDGGMSRSAK